MSTTRQAAVQASAKAIKQLERECDKFLEEDPMDNSFGAIADYKRSGVSLKERVILLQVQFKDDFEELEKHQQEWDAFNRVYPSDFASSYLVIMENCQQRINERVVYFTQKLDEISEGMNFKRDYHRKPSQFEFDSADENRAGNLQTTERAPALNGGIETPHPETNRAGMFRKQSITTTNAPMKDEDVSKSSTTAAGVLIAQAMKTSDSEFIQTENSAGFPNVTSAGIHGDTYLDQSVFIENYDEPVTKRANILQQSGPNSVFNTDPMQTRAGSIREDFILEMMRNNQDTTQQTLCLLAKHIMNMDNKELRNERATTPNMSYPRLKELPLPTFSGERPHESWCFWNEFECYIGSRPDLKDFVKLTYLRHALQKPAKCILDGLSLEGDNYEYAVRELKKKYGDWDVVEEASFQRLQSIAERVCSMESIALLKLYYEHKVIIRSLQTKSTLGIAHIQLIKKSYPWKLMKQVIEREAEFKEMSGRVWKVDELLAGIQQAIAVLEMKERNFPKGESENVAGIQVNYLQGKYQDASYQQPRFNQQQRFRSYQRHMEQRFKPSNNERGSQHFGQHRHQLFEQSNFPRRPNGSSLRSANVICIGCGFKGHYLSQCKDATSLQQREDAVGTDRCRQCISRNHPTNQCPNARCAKCSGPHCLALCPDMYSNGVYDANLSPSRNNQQQNIKYDCQQKYSNPDCANGGF